MCMLVCVTGNLQVADMADMLKSLCMPPWGTLAKSAYNMGYVLQRTMIRCGARPVLKQRDLQPSLHQVHMYPTTAVTHRR